MEYDKSKNISGDAIEWNKNFNENDNNFWENISEENIINDNDEYNIYESIIIKMKRFTYLSMDLVLTPLQKKCYIDYYKYENGDKVEMIANELGISCATVYKHVRIANAKLYAIGNLFLKSCGYKSYYEGITKTIFNCLHILDYDEREVIKNYYIYGNNIGYIAKKFDLPKNVIYELYNSGTKKLIKNTSISKKCLHDIRSCNVSKRIMKNTKRYNIYYKKDR